MVPFQTVRKVPVCIFLLRAALLAFLETILRRLFIIRSFFIRPPLVYFLVPFQTVRKVPVCIFLVTRFGFLGFTVRRAFLVLRAALRLAAFGFEALAAFGAFGFLAFRAARRVARLAARRFAARGFVALRATDLTAIV